MTEVYPDAGLVAGLKRFYGDTLHYWLYLNNATPTSASVISDFTTDTDVPPLDMEVADLTLESLAAHIARITGPDLAFVATTTTHDVYGYFVTTGAASGVPAGDLVKAARFDGAPYSISPTVAVNIVPTFAMKPIP